MSDRARVTYAIVAHSREQQLLRLVRAIREESPGSSVVIHWDRESPPLDRAPLVELGNVHMVANPTHPGWGDVGLAIAPLRAMQTAVEQTEFDWLVLLSGQDYPIAPLEQVERELAASDCDALLDAGRVASGGLAFAWRKSEATRLGRRYYFAYWQMPSLRQRFPGVLRRAALRIAFFVDERQPFLALWPMPNGVPWRLGVRRLRTPFGPAQPCRVGSAWFSLSRRGVDRVLARAGERSPLVRHYRRTIIPDESLFQTIVCSDSELTVSPDNRRYQVWRGTPSPLHPETLNSTDLDAMLRSGKHFARKFDQERDARVLDWIDDHRRTAALQRS